MGTVIYNSIKGAIIGGVGFTLIVLLSMFIVWDFRIETEVYILLRACTVLGFIIGAIIGYIDK